MNFQQRLTLAQQSPGFQRVATAEFAEQLAAECGSEVRPSHVLAALVACGIRLTLDEEGVAFRAFLWELEVLERGRR